MEYQEKPTRGGTEYSDLALSRPPSLHRILQSRLGMIQRFRGVKREPVECETIPLRVPS